MINPQNVYSIDLTSENLGKWKPIYLLEHSSTDPMTYRNCVTDFQLLILKNWQIPCTLRIDYMRRTNEEGGYVTLKSAQHYEGDLNYAVYHFPVTITMFAPGICARRPFTSCNTKFGKCEARKTAARGL